jgi:hypothetical protein
MVDVALGAGIKARRHARLEGPARIRLDPQEPVHDRARSWNTGVAGSSTGAKITLE